MVSIAPRWDNAEDDEAVHAAHDGFLNRTVALAKEMGLWTRYIYQNYADISQDVFAGYGEDNRAKLREIQQRYDPSGMFSRLQPGYSKL